MKPLTYAEAGVDIEAGDAAVELMKASVKRTTRPEVVGGLGGFAGLFALDLSRWTKPLLASSTDGVGTKLAIARDLGVHDTVGIDLVAMVVDDVVVAGAEPLFMQDYIAVDTVVPEKVAAIVAGIAEGCVRAGCSLVGGETAEHGDQMRPGDYDISGTAVGVVEADRVLGPDRVRTGDVLIALASSGLHSNGYSLVRRAVRGQDYASTPDELAGRTLGDELLTPTRIYALDCLALMDAVEVHAYAHITGGGLPGNVNRLLPTGTTAWLDRTTWTPPGVFDLIGRLGGGVADDELARTFNLGVGMVAAVPADDVDRALAVLAGRGLPSWVIGEVRAAEETAHDQQVVLTGSHPRLR